MYKYLDEFNSYAVIDRPIDKTLRKEIYPFQRSEPIPFGKEPWRESWNEEVAKQKIVTKKTEKSKQSRTVLKNLQLLELLTEELKSKLVYESEEEIRKMDVVLILDIEMNFVDVVKSKDAVRYWVVDEGFQSSLPGRQTIYNYIKDKKLFYDKYFFVPLKTYEEFMK